VFSLLEERAFSNNPSIRFKATSVLSKTAAWYEWEDMAAPPHQQPTLST
jgi:hypothetical protein